MLQNIAKNYARFLIRYIAWVPWYSVPISFQPSIHTLTFNRQTMPRAWWLKKKCYRLFRGIINKKYLEKRLNQFGGNIDFLTTCGKKSPFIAIDPPPPRECFSSKNYCNLEHLDGRVVSQKANYPEPPLLYYLYARIYSVVI